jgi:hypothetical protein
MERVVFAPSPQQLAAAAEREAALRAEYARIACTASNF